MVCSQCGAGMTPEMVKAGACGFCGTAVEGVAQAHLQERVDERVREAEDKLRRDLARELKDELDEREPSAVAVAAAEAGRYTAAKVWGCGAGCVSTIGSILLLLIILGVSVLPVMYEQWLEHEASKPKVEQPKSHPTPAPNKKKRRKR